MATGTTAANTVTARSRSGRSPPGDSPPGLTRMRSPPVGTTVPASTSGKKAKARPIAHRPRSSSALRRAGARRGRDEALRQDGPWQAARSTDRRCARGAREAPRPARRAAVPGRARRLPKTPQLAIAGVGSGRRVGRARRLQLRAPERLTRSRPRGSGCRCEGVRAIDLSPVSYVLRHTFASNAPRSSAGVGSLELAW